MMNLEEAKNLIADIAYNDSLAGGQGRIDVEITAKIFEIDKDVLHKQVKDILNAKFAKNAERWKKSDEERFKRGLYDRI
jgi:SOS response regulatory protein OraA/RecX